MHCICSAASASAVRDTRERAECLQLYRQSNPLGGKQLTCSCDAPTIRMGAVGASSGTSSRAYTWSKRNHEPHSLNIVASGP